ncbi:MAG TPA: SDR family oxidoreductase [Pseudonocardiaceae bacterium]|nr:SDR family oxidoreductase [Pseudonocardiaceae bacterium]
MKIDLSNKTAIVTGSTAGIGFAIAKGFAQAGAVVVVNGRSEAAVDDAVTRLAKTAPGAVIRGRAADVGTVEGCSALVAAEPSTDILVNNVGIYGLEDFFGSILQRAASVDEVANLVVYAASPQASATTGAALRVDGGVVETIM